MIVAMVEMPTEKNRMLNSRLRGMYISLNFNRVTRGILERFQPG